MSTITHYTSLQGLVSMLLGGRCNSLCMRASRYDDMNDPLECESLLSMPQQNEHPIFPYVVSFSKKNDHPVMWRLYKAQVAVEINRAKLEKVCQEQNVDYLYRWYMGDCSYAGDSSQLTVIPNDVHEDKLQQIERAFRKHHDFEIEDECRIMLFNLSNLEDPNKELKRRVKPDGTIALYKEVFIPLSCVNRILLYVFDNEHFTRQKKYITDILGEYYPGVSIDIEKTNCTPVINR